MDFPRTLLDFVDQFPDEEACWRYLKRVRWPKGFRCPLCGAAEASYLRPRRLFQCTRCRRQVSVTAGTIFHGTRTELRKWFLAIFFFARHKQSISALQLQRDLGLGSYQTAWTMLHKLRSTLHRRPGQLLRGVVEADEAFVGGRRQGGKRGRGSPNKTIVSVLVERRGQGAGSVALVPVEDNSWASLGPAVRGSIEGAATTLLTDDWSGYWPLASQGVDHRPEKQGDPARAGEILHWAHVVISNLKAWLLGTFRGVTHKHLPRYLTEFAYRLNRRSLEDKLFFYVTRRAVQAEPLPYSRLVAEPVG